MSSNFNHTNNDGNSEEEHSSNRAISFQIFSDNESDGDVNDDVNQIGDQANIPDQNNNNGNHNGDHQVQVPEPNPNSSTTQFTTKKRGRKKKDSNEKGDHDKYAETISYH